MLGARMSVRMTPLSFAESERTPDGVWPKPSCPTLNLPNIWRLVSPATAEIPSRLTKIANWSRMYANTTMSVRMIDVKSVAVRMAARIATEGER